jgi:hypothetical protein
LDFRAEGLAEFNAHANNPGTTPNEGSLTPLTIESTLINSGDVDYFRYLTTSDALTFTVSLKTAGISLLDGKLTVLDAYGNVVQSVVAPDPTLGQDVSITVTANAGVVYYFKVERDRVDINRVFNIGNYRLAVTPAPPNLDYYFSVHGEPVDPETPQYALTLTGAATQTNDRFDFIQYGNIDTGGDVDYYRFQAPNSGGTPQSMTAMVWGRDANGLLPAVTVYDSLGNPVSATILQNSNGTEIVQISNAVSNATYFVSVKANTSGNAAGRYFLGIDFSTSSHELDQTFASGSVSTAAPVRGSTANLAMSHLNVAANTVFHLDISATNPNETGETAIRVFLLQRTNGTIYDKVVYDSNKVIAGQSVSVNLFLAGDDYELIVAGGALNNATQPPISFIVQGTGLTDPIDPQLIDPNSPPAIHPFLWTVDPNFRNFLSVLNPYGIPIFPGSGGGGPPPS